MSKIGKRNEMVIIISKGYIREHHRQKPMITFTWEWNGVYRDSRNANFEYESKKEREKETGRNKEMWVSIYS